MKLSIVLSTQPTSFSALVYNEKLEESIDQMKELGYDGIELAVRDPALLDRDKIKKIVQSRKLDVPAIGTGQIFLEEGLSFTDKDPAVRRSAIQRIKSHIELAGSLNAMVIIGLVRGRNQEKVDEGQITEWLSEAFNEFWLFNKSVKLVIEPINRYETNIFNTVQEGLNFLKILNQENVGLLLDTFHMNIEEPSITESILEARDHIFHFHVADSNRWYPGAGHIDFESIVRTLNEIDYKGYISAEMLPFPDPATSSMKTMEYMKPLLK